MEALEHPATILLVDDEEPIRRLVRGLLVEQGFHVIEASDGAEALEVAAASTRPIHMLVTDVIIPKVNGLILADQLSNERPGLRVL
jgi:DNA-binding NtrC family response regulator